MKKRSLFLTTSFCFVFLAGIGFSQIIDAATRGSSVFPDVTMGTFYDEAIGEMNALGIIKGYDNGNFGPNDNVTRGQIAVLMKRLRDELKGSGISSSSSSRSSSSSTTSSSSSSTSTATGNRQVRFSTDTISLSESVATLNVSILRVGDNSGTASVSYTITGSTALKGQDFTANNGTVSFNAGESSKVISISMINDTIGEPLETFTIELANATNASVGSPGKVTVSIVDNDGGTTSSSSSVSSGTSGGFSFGAAKYSVNENQSNITITVVRSAGTSAAATVNYATSNGSALTSHYTAANGTLSFAAGETSKSFTVTVNNDAAITGNRTVNLTLSSPTGSTQLGPSTSELTIVDDDMSSFTSGTGAFRFTATNYTVTEGSTATIRVQRIGGHNGTISVSYAMGGGSAAAGVDYTGVSGTLTFASGETEKSFTITTIDDTNSENQEIATINLSSPTGGATISEGTTELRINE